MIQDQQTRWQCLRGEGFRACGGGLQLVPISTSENPQSNALVINGMKLLVGASRSRREQDARTGPSKLPKQNTRRKKRVWQNGVLLDESYAGDCG